MKTDSNKGTAVSFKNIYIHNIYIHIYGNIYITIVGGKNLPALTGRRKIQRHLVLGVSMPRANQDLAWCFSLEKTGKVK